MKTKTKKRKLPEHQSLKAHDPKVKSQIQKGREFMEKYRETFKALAK